METNNPVENVNDSKKRKKLKLPTTGQKIFDSKGTQAENDDILRILNEHKQLLEETCVKKNCMLEAIWLPELKKARVMKAVGKYLETFGHSEDEDVFFYLEETLFLVETNSLILQFNDQSLSKQECYHTLLDSTSTCSFAEYRAYRHLALYGFKLFRIENNSDDVYLRKETLRRLRHFVKSLFINGLNVFVGNKLIKDAAVIDENVSNNLVVLNKNTELENECYILMETQKECLKPISQVHRTTTEGSSSRVSDGFNVDEGSEINSDLAKNSVLNTTYGNEDDSSFGISEENSEIGDSDVTVINDNVRTNLLALPTLRIVYNNDERTLLVSTANVSDHDINDEVNSYPTCCHRHVKRIIELTENYNDVIGKLKSVNSELEINDILNTVNGNDFLTLEMKDVLKFYFTKKIPKTKTDATITETKPVIRIEDNNVQPLLDRRNRLNYADTFKRLQIFQKVDYSLIEVAEYVEKVKYEVYYPCSKFPKSNRPTPHYRLMIVQGNEAVPSAAKLNAVRDKFEDDVALLLAIVFHENISFLRVSNVCTPQLID